MAAVATLLRGWKAYFQYGYPRRIFRRLNYDVQAVFAAFCGIGAIGAAVRFDRARVSMRSATLWTPLPVTASLTSLRVLCDDACR